MVVSRDDPLGAAIADRIRALARREVLASSEGAHCIVGRVGGSHQDREGGGTLEELRRSHQRVLVRPSTLSLLPVLLTLSLLASLFREAAVKGTIGTLMVFCIWSH